MKIYFASYATHDAMGFYKNQDSLAEQARIHGCVDEVIKCRGNDLKDFLEIADDFIKKVEPPKYPRMHNAKYYVWKSYFILDCLRKINHNDVLIIWYSNLPEKLSAFRIIFSGIPITDIESSLVNINSENKPALRIVSPSSSTMYK